MDRKGKLIGSQSRDQVDIFMQKMQPQEYPVRVSGKGSELVEANGSIKIISHGKSSTNKIFGLENKNF